jgi:glycosyltransferase involved in cell wall biosynthesis
MKSISFESEIKLPYEIKYINNLDRRYSKLYNYLNKFDNHFNQVILSIILPLYNEEKTIRKVVDDLPHHKLIEIIVVDDFSKDGSINQIKSCQTTKGIKILKHKMNKGYGNAILTGIKNARGKIIITMDSDGQHYPGDIFKMIKPLLNGDADITIGSRYLGKYFYKLPLRTCIGELGIEKIVYLLFRKKIMNNQNGFRAFKRQVIDIFEDVCYTGYAFCTEIILKAILKNYKIKEIPIKLYNRQYGSSKIEIKKLAINLLFCIIQYTLGKIITYKRKYSSSRIYNFVSKFFKLLMGR